MKRTARLNIFSYTNYRRFVEDYFSNQKARDPKFTHRLFALRAGYNSSGLLIDVINGRTNIHSDLIAKFARGLSLKKRESRYFDNLVRFNQAKTLNDKNLYFERMTRFFTTQAHEIKKGEYEYFSQWYYTAIRELLSIVDFKDDYAALTQSLVPSISTPEAKRAIAVLQKFGFIKKNKQGFYKAVQPAITTDPNFKSFNLRNFQRCTIDLAKEALDRFNENERNISTLTFSAGPKTMQQISVEIDAARTRIIDIIRRGKDEDRICQLNFQLFPMSRNKKKQEIKE